MPNAPAGYSKLPRTLTLPAQPPNPPTRLLQLSSAPEKERKAVQKKVEAAAKRVERYEQRLEEVRQRKLASCKSSRSGQQLGGNEGSAVYASWRGNVSAPWATAALP